MYRVRPDRPALDERPGGGRTARPERDQDPLVGGPAAGVAVLVARPVLGVEAHRDVIVGQVVVLDDLPSCGLKKRGSSTEPHFSIRRGSAITQRS